jgi:transposase
VASKSGCILATHEGDPTTLPAHEVLAGAKGHRAPERGVRLLKAPRLLASSWYLKKPERLMALLMVMTVWLRVYAALAYRIRQALQGPQETFPEQKGQPGQTPTARWGFHYFVGMHIRLGRGEAPLVLHRNAQPQLVLRLLGTAYETLYS